MNEPHTPRKTIRHPRHRDAFVNGAAAAGIEGNNLHWIRLAVTPAPLRDVPNHSIRGRKSLTRIQQITNALRYKTRPGLSR